MHTCCLYFENIVIRFLKMAVQLVFKETVKNEGDWGVLGGRGRNMTRKIHILKDFNCSLEQ